MLWYIWSQLVVAALVAVVVVAAVVAVVVVAAVVAVVAVDVAVVVVAVVDHVAAVVPAVAAVVGHASKTGECNQGCSLFRPDFFLPSLVFYSSHQVSSRWHGCCGVDAVLARSL